MGILDDLAMGFGFKERTADYDARTARTIAARDATAAARAGGAGDHAAMVAGIRARQNYDFQNPTGQSKYYLDRAGRAAGIDNYRPYAVDDDRPFMQRILTSPDSPPSPRPYAIGPVDFDEPLPAIGPFGVAMSLLNRVAGVEPEPNMLMDKGVLTETESSNDAILDRVFGQGYASRLRQVGDVEYYKQQLEEAKKFL